MERVQFSDLSEGLNIFLVESDPDTLAALRGHLEHRGHQVTCVASPSEALEKLVLTDVQVLIVNIGRDGAGWGLIPSANLPRNVCCVAISGFGAEAHHEKSKTAGFHFHLNKPFELDKLDGILAEVVRQLPLAGETGRDGTPHDGELAFPRDGTEGGGHSPARSDGEFPRDRAV